MLTQCGHSGCPCASVKTLKVEDVMERRMSFLKV